MQEIFPTQKDLRDLYEYDPGGFLVNKKTGKKRTGSALRNGRGYRLLSMYSKGKFYGRLYHRMIWLWHHGSLPEQLDHANGDRGDNKIENLRPCTRSQNQANRFGNKNRSHGLTMKGVHLSGRKSKPFRACIIHAGKYKNLGRFKTEEEAGRAYLEAAQNIHGEFAKGMRPNGPS